MVGRTASFRLREDCSALAGLPLAEKSAGGNVTLGFEATIIRMSD